MMRKMSILVLAISLLTISCQYGECAVLMVKNKGGGGAGYLSDANNKATWFWKSNGGNEAEQTGNGSALVETGGTIPTSATIPSGFSGTARDLEDDGGVDIYFTQADGLSTDISGADAKMSFVTWVRVEDITANAFFVVMGKDQGDSSNDQFIMFLVEQDPDEFKFQFNISSTGNGYTTVSSTLTNYQEKTYYHFGVVVNDIDLRIYVDGVLACTPVAHTAGIYNGGAPFFMGWKTGWGENYDGLYYESAMFDRALTATEMLDIKQNGITGDKGVSH